MSIPSLFRKRYTEKKLNAKIFRRIYIPTDAEWLRRLFKQNESGLYALDAGDPVSKETEKKLKELAKSIKKNRGIISRPKVFIAVLALALVCGGYYFFRNILIEKALVSALELVFQARAAVTNLNFDLFDAKLEWTRLEVANRDRPMKNLFETGYSEAHLSMRDLLKARFIVQNLEVRDIRWNTERKTSGALPRSAEPEKEESGAFLKSVSASVVSVLTSIDVKALLEKEYEKLATPKTAEKLKTELESQTAFWRGKISDVRGEIQSLQGSVNEIRNLNVRSIKSPEEVITLVTKINAVVATVQKTTDTAETLRQDFEAAAKTALRAKDELQESVQSDYAYAASLVSLSGDGALSLASGLFADFAREHLGSWYAYGMRALEIARNLPESKPEEKKEAEADIPRYGRIISYPVWDKLPKLWIKNIAFNSIGNADQKLNGKATDITGAPDLIGKPAAFALSFAMEDKLFGLEGNIDMRRNAKADADMRLVANGLPIKLKFPSPVLTIRSLEGPLNTDASMKILRGGGMSGELRGSLTAPRLEREGKGDRMSDMAYSVLASVPVFDADLRYELTPARGLDLSFTSSVDNALKDSFRRYLKEQEAVYRELIRQELKKRLDAYIAGNETLQKGIADLHKLVGDNLTDVNAYKKVLEDKRKELESRLDTLKKQAADSLLKEAQKNLPALPIPVPGGALGPFPKF